MALKGVTITSPIQRHKGEAKEQPLWVTPTRTTEAHLDVPLHPSYRDRTAYKDLSCTLSCIVKAHKQLKENKISHSYRKGAKIKSLTQQSSGVWTYALFHLIPSIFLRSHLKVADSLHWQNWFCTWRTPALNHNSHTAHTQVQKHTWKASLFYFFCALISGWKNRYLWIFKVK